MSIRACLGVAATVTLLGCGLSTWTTPLSGPYPQRPADAEVRVWSVAIPECPFEEVGLITVREGIGARGPAVLVVSAAGVNFPFVADENVTRRRPRSGR